MIARCQLHLAYAGILILGMSCICCSTSNPNTDRALISIAVTPETADAADFASGQVVFTATGTFNQPPITAPVTFTAPYTGSFAVDNPDNEMIASVVSSGSGTVTVECASGVSGTVEIIASAAANNGTAIVITGGAQLNCP
jgi:hypothetical protein